MIRVLIVDDHQVVRQGLGFLLEEDGIQVIGESADGPSAIQAVRTLEPTVVLLDLFLPGQDGISVLAQIKQDRPATEVLMLTSAPEQPSHPALAAHRARAAWAPSAPSVGLPSPHRFQAKYNVAFQARYNVARSTPPARPRR